MAAFVSEQLEQGVPPGRVAELLVSHGYSPADALFNVRTIQEQIKEVKRAVMREEAVGDFIWGGLVAIIGGTITVVTYLGASAGESYVVAWGALLYGGFRLIRGLSKWLS